MTEEPLQKKPTKDERRADGPPTPGLLPPIEPREPWAGKPSYALWEITRACNLRCKHCAAGAGKRAGGELSTAEAEAVCEELAAIGVPSVCLMGGEVFIRRDWDVIAAKLRSLGMHVGIISNGWLLEGGIVRRLEALGVCQVGISLDAARPELHDEIRGVRGSHERALRGIRTVRSLSFLTYRTVITSVHKGNLGELEGLEDLLVEEAAGFNWMVNTSSPHTETRMPREECLDEDGFLRLVRFIAGSRAAIRDRLRLSATHDLGYFSRRFPDLHDFTWEGCPAGFGTLGITAEGNVKGCLILSDRFIEGNVRSRRLRDIWRDPRGFPYNRSFDAGWLRGKCRGCVHGPACRGGCRDHAESFTGSPFEAPFCLHHLEERGLL